MCNRYTYVKYTCAEQNRTETRRSATRFADHGFHHLCESQILFTNASQPVPFRRTPLLVADEMVRDTARTSRLADDQDALRVATKRGDIFVHPLHSSALVLVGVEEIIRSHSHSLAAAIDQIPGCHSSQCSRSLRRASAAHQRLRTQTPFKRKVQFHKSVVNKVWQMHTEQQFNLRAYV